MLITEFFSNHKSEKKDIQMKILEDIISYKANYIFADKVIDILAKRNPDYDNRDEDTKFKIRDFQADRNTAFEGGYHLRVLYESEYGKITDDIEKTMKEVAESFANAALASYGWIERKSVA